MGFQKREENSDSSERFLKKENWTSSCELKRSLESAKREGMSQQTASTEGLCSKMTKAFRKVKERSNGSANFEEKFAKWVPEAQREGKKEKRERKSMHA